MKKLVLLIFLSISCLSFSQNDYLLGENYYREGAYEKAAQVFKSLYLKSPFNTSYLSRLISCYQETDKFLEAEKLLKSKIKKNYFKIIQLNNTLTLKKNKENIYLHVYKSYLNNNLIQYKEHDFKLTEPITVYLENYILAFWEPSYKKWNYIYYNDQVNQFLFDSKTAKEIIQLYFDEIFVPAKVPWSKKDLNDFYKIYNEYKYDDTYDGLDFDKFCKCKIKFEEKIEKVEEIPSQYYESESYYEIIQKCMIYSKIN